jgi:hypothetical protein
MLNITKILPQQELQTKHTFKAQANFLRCLRCNVYSITNAITSVNRNIAYTFLPALFHTPDRRSCSTIDRVEHPDKSLCDFSIELKLEHHALTLTSYARSCQHTSFPPFPIDAVNNLDGLGNN